MGDSKNQGSKPSEFMPEIRRARVAQLMIYEVSEIEIEALAKGSSSQKSNFGDFGLQSQSI